MCFSFAEAPPSPESLVNQMIHNPMMASGRKFALVLETRVQHGEEVLLVTFNGVGKEVIKYRDLITSWIPLGDHTKASTTASQLLRHVVTIPEKVHTEWRGEDWEEDHPLRTIGGDGDADLGTSDGLKYCYIN